MKPKLTNEQKEHKRQLDVLLRERNRCLSAWSFKRIQTYEDLLVETLNQDKESLRIYYPLEQLSTIITHKQVFDYFESYRESINWSFAKNGNIHKRPEPTAHTYEGFTYSPTGNESSSKSEFSTTEDRLLPAKIPDASEEALDNLLPPSAKQKCFLFPFQNRSAKKLLDGILIHKYRGQLLRAGVGTGKTYIVGGVARRLLDMEYCKGKTYSPWAMCWITRASIVEQTKRVLEEQFSINTVNELQVINIEQLRTSFGELMVRSETIVERGEEHIVWRWRPNVHPIIFFIDESQFAKNEGSQQSKIIQAIADIDNPNVYCIFFSATPLLKCTDAKYLVLNMRLKTDGMTAKVIV